MRTMLTLLSLADPRTGGKKVLLTPIKGLQVIRVESPSIIQLARDILRSFDETVNKMNNITAAGERLGSVVAIWLYLDAVTDISSLKNIHICHI